MEVHSKTSRSSNTKPKNMVDQEQPIRKKPRQKLISPQKIYEFHEMEAPERKAFVKEVIERIKELMRNHIGRELAINSHELFESVYMITSETLTEYEARFWRDLLNRIIAHLRNKEELFIINEAGKFIYVLKNTFELKIFKNQMDNYIQGCNDMKSKAERWVRNKKWKQ